MPSPTARLAAALLLLPALAACQRETPAQRAAREAARRDACIAGELAIAARNRFASMDDMMRNAQAGDSPLATAMQGPYSFARALNDYAQTRRSALALEDSAANARSAEDSARFVEEGRRFQMAAPAPGTLEGNVAARWAEDFTVARRNPDHPCNKPEETARP